MNLQENIILIDNASTYPPLVKYLETVPYKIIYLEKNYGSYALWSAGIVDPATYPSYYVYTDPDIIPIPECPNDIIEYLISILEKYPDALKAGIGLRIDNLPDTEIGNKAREWERSWWNAPLGNNLYTACLDTTFSVYRPNGATGHQIGIRTGHPYMAEHTTWYEDFTNLSEELKYYVKSIEYDWTHWFREEYSKNLVNRITK
jgi:hypothetical protein